MGSESKEEILLRNGVFIHKIPFKFKNEAISLFKREFIYDVDHDPKYNGFCIYFKNFQIAKDVVHGRRIKVIGCLYDTSFATTTLTLQEIPKYVEPKPIIKSRLGEQVMDISQIVREDGSFDYRIVCKCPEIYANYPTPPIDWNGRLFPLSFYCQLCSGKHKAVQCPSLRKSSTLKYASSSVNEEPPEDCQSTNAHTSGSFSKLRGDTGKPGVNYRKSNVLVKQNVSRHSASSENSASQSSYVCSKSQSLKIDSNIKKQSIVKIEKQPQHEKSNKKCKSRKREMCYTLSTEIKRAISKTSGVISSDSLQEFLIQAKCQKSKKLMEIANRLTEDISGLIDQLESVCKYYYTKTKRRSSRGNHDAERIANIQKRLKEQLILRQEAEYLEAQHSSSRTVDEASAQQQSLTTGLTDISESD